MKQLLRRMTSLMMALLVLVSLLPLQSFAAEADSTTTSTGESTTAATIETNPEEAVETTDTSELVTEPLDEEKLTGSQQEPVSFYLLNSKTRAIVDQAVTKSKVYTGEFWYDLWYLNKWTDSWEIWGSYWFSEFSFFEFASGTIGYCIQPYNTLTSLNQDRIAISWGDVVTPYRTSSDGFEEAKAEGISLVLAYGAPNNGDTTTSGYYATAAVLWAIACGHIRPNGTLRDGETPFLGALEKGFWNDVEMYKEIETKYNELLICLQNHGKIPSFSAGSRAGLTDANTIMLQHDASSGQYTTSVTDTNDILKYFNYQSSIEGLTFEKSGNVLTVKATPEAVAQLGSSTVIHSRGHEIIVGPDSVIVWNTEDNASQTMVTMNVAADPVPSFFTLAVPKGDLKIVKTTEDGNNLAGWQFGIYSDEACTTMISDPHTSGSDGTITVSGLDIGTVWVKEIGHSEEAVDELYMCNSTNPQQVMIQSGQTATLIFQNNLSFGKCRIIKKLANPEVGTMEYWDFAITDEWGSEIGTYQTDISGTILVDLKPGIYTVTEILEADSLWQCTTENPRMITVEAGEIAEVIFTNALRNGEIVIQKVNQEGQPLAGAEFLLEWSEDGINWYPVTYTDSMVVSMGTCSAAGLTGGKLVSGGDGRIVFSGLYPTTQYRLSETKAPDGYQLLAGSAYEGVLPVDGNLTVSLTVVNMPTFMLPETGSTDLSCIPLTAALCIWSGAGLLLYLRKRQGG